MTMMMRNNFHIVQQFLEPLGKIKIVSVVPSDEFQGVWKDLI